jgi:hypothetical protein
MRNLNDGVHHPYNAKIINVKQVFYHLFLSPNSLVSYGGLKILQVLDVNGY